VHTNGRRGMVLPIDSQTLRRTVLIAVALAVILSICITSASSQTKPGKPITKAPPAPTRPADDDDLLKLHANWVERTRKAKETVAHLLSAPIAGKENEIASALVDAGRGKEAVPYALTYLRGQPGGQKFLDPDDAKGPKFDAKDLFDPKKRDRIMKGLDAVIKLGGVVQIQYLLTIVLQFAAEAATFASGLAEARRIFPDTKQVLMPQSSAITSLSLFRAQGEDKLASTLARDCQAMEVAHWREDWKSTGEWKETWGKLGATAPAVRITEKRGV